MWQCQLKDIRRATRKQYSAEEKIRIVLDGLRSEHSIAEPCQADVYFGRGQTILLERERIKRATIQNRRLQHQMNAA